MCVSSRFPSRLATGALCALRARWLLQGEVHFTLLMTSKLVGDVKLVGPTINCEGTAEFATGERRQNPHVQSFAVATDAEGMQLLIDSGHVFKCYDHFEDTIYYSELGSSAVILNAGYNLDSFMVCAFVHHLPVANASSPRQLRPL